MASEARVILLPVEDTPVRRGWLRTLTRCRC
jgi:hypothetical protein